MTAEQKGGVASLFDVQKFAEASEEELRAVDDIDSFGKERALCNAGLGTGIAGTLVRSALSNAGANMICSPMPVSARGAGQMRRPTTPLDVPHQDGPGSVDSLKEQSRTQGLFKTLVLNEHLEVNDDDLYAVREHRWTFKGADAVARKGRNACFFVRCLLDLQRNVQLEEDDALDSKLVTACRLFVHGRCRDGRHGEMYQLLTHFLSNSKVFEEWDNYLQKAYALQDADKENVIVPWLEQVWARYCRLAQVLADIFKVLDSQFAWRHRLPKVQDLICEHMKRRCFPREKWLKNDLFAQEKCSNETLKEIKRAFGFNL